ncbi:quinone oxidoreductase family protein [Phaeacidiphilus oryzae]|uniref:quinone oxidoreductase family protein n=1 Tax=Phaeacidiphilus oryzae TaxID=348818 RepID=UPI000567ED13|nr:zinc-binding dehydrogenase [Phaeacidiphilus oryzae]
MRAAELSSWGTEVRLVERPEPVPGAGEVRVGMEAANVGHLDLTVMSGTFAHRPELPFTPGTSGVGRVIGTAEGEERWKGRRVLLRGGGLGLERPGTWAERTVVSGAVLREIPESADAGLAATCYSPLSTGWASVDAVGRVQAGEVVVVTGASGAVGSMCVQLAHRAGARVLAMVSGPERTGLVPAGAEEVLAGWDEEAVRRIAAAGGADVLIDPVGGDTLPLLLPALRPGARVVLVGYVRGKALSVDLPNLLAADVSLLPVNMIRREVPDEVFDGLLGDLIEGRLTLGTAVRPLSEISEALRVLQAPGTGGTVAVTC